MYPEVMKDGGAFLAGLEPALHLHSGAPLVLLPGAVGPHSSSGIPGQPVPTPSGKALCQHLAVMAVTSAKQPPILVSTLQWNDGDR